MKLNFKYRETWWWHFVHYNYFHRRLFKEFYKRHARFTKEQIKKYHLFQKIDDLITLRKWDWLRVFIWKLDWKINISEAESQSKPISMSSEDYYNREKWPEHK